MNYLAVAVIGVGVLGLVNLLLIAAMARRLREQGEQFARQAAGRMPRPVVGLAPGTAVPEFSVTTASGAVVSAADLGEHGDREHQADEAATGQRRVRHNRRLVAEHAGPRTTHGGTVAAVVAVSLVIAGPCRAEGPEFRYPRAARDAGARRGLRQQARYTIG